MQEHGMKHRICVVTGASRGIGRATALELARRGATVVMLGRDATQGEHAAEEIRRASSNTDVTFVTGDLASFTSLRAATRAIDTRFPAVHVLVNNAGVSMPRRAESADGFEMTLAVNYLGPFVLTKLLLPLLQRGAPARVINVTSWFERFGRLDLADLELTRRYSGDRAYMQSKIAIVLFTNTLAKRLSAMRITANCVDPGLVATDLLRARWWWRTPLLAPLWRLIFLTPEQGAQAALFAASSPSLESVTGVCIDRQGRTMTTSTPSRNEALGEALWHATEAMVGRVK
jgi:NAD(P)-dependent dehydrogenase (short-subunit alcohol dehydrogenase family)